MAASNDYQFKSRTRVAKYLTAGAHSFTVPNNVTTLHIAAIAGGGAGGEIRDNSGGRNGKGGDSGAFGEFTITVTPSQVISITVGAGGVFGALSGKGGDTIVNGVTFEGGYGGLAPEPGYATLAGSSRAESVVNSAGTDTVYAVGGALATTPVGDKAGGGSAGWGPGGAGGEQNVNGTAAPASSNGAGGGCGGGTGGFLTLGGNGAPGGVIISWVEFEF